MNKKASISKERNAKHVKILEGLLRLPENRECADCKNKGPRWASINLGIFICLQCSGIHRSLGVHISKVRSATLDIWLPEQITFVQNMGNEKSNAYWEAELPTHYDRSRFENFIRAKYVDKLWIPRESKLNSPPKSSEERASPTFSSSTNPRIEINDHSLVEEQEISRDEKVIEKKDCLIDKRRDVDRDNPGEMRKDIANGQTEKIIPDSGLKNDLQKKDSVVIQEHSSAATNVGPVITPPKVDYTTELFRMLWVDDSSESDSSPSSDISTWVDFDTDEEETVQGNVASSGKLHSEPKTKDATIHNQPSHPEKMLSNPQSKFTPNIAPYTTSSLYKRAPPVNGVSTSPARKPPAALPVSGYDYDFSFLTQGMFTKH